MDTSSWKQISLEYSESSLKVKVPPYCDVLHMDHVPALENPKREIENALSNPIGSRPIEEIVSSHKRPPSKLSVAIAVSDNTRPVPYSGKRKDGILLPLLMRLKRAGIKERNVKIIVATGTHLPTSRHWKEQAFGEFITSRYRIIDHDCTSPDLSFIGNIEGISVKVNRHFLEADVHIITGLVEPHFMAGLSGGRKAVCPGLVNFEAIQLFHGTKFLDSPQATNLVLDDNPCHNFALKVARKARVDFSVNVVLNGEMRLAGVFAGDLEKAHLEAARKVKRYSLIPVEQEYDIVLTHGGKVAVNHYQAAKAAYGASPIIKKGGLVILVAHNSDKEPVGKDDYKRVMRILKERGPGKFSEFIKRKDWEFVPDQWQAQKWDQFFKKIGSFDRLIYCTTNIAPADLKKLPGKSGYDFIRGKDVRIEQMVQNAIFYAVDEMRQKVKKPKMALIKEGPYAVPVLKKALRENK